MQRGRGPLAVFSQCTWVASLGALTEDDVSSRGKMGPILLGFVVGWIGRSVLAGAEASRTPASVQGYRVGDLGLDDMSESGPPPGWTDNGDGTCNSPDGDHVGLDINQAWCLVLPPGTCIDNTGPLFVSSEGGFFQGDGNGGALFPASPAGIYSSSFQGYRVGDSFSDGPAPGFVDNGDGTATSDGSLYANTAMGYMSADPVPVSYARSWEIWTEFNGQGGPDLDPFDPNAPFAGYAVQGPIHPSRAAPRRKR